MLMNATSPLVGNECRNTTTIPITNDAVAANWLYTETDKMIITFLIPITIVVGVTGNLAFLFMVSRLKRMHNVTNIYLANIAVADIILVSYSPIVYVLSYFTSPIVHHMPVENSAGCFIAFFLSNFGYTASINIFTLVSFERWLAICRPLQHRRMTGERRTMKFVFAAWIIAAVFSCLIAPKYGRSVRLCMDWPDSPQYDDLPRYLHTCRSIKHFETHPEILDVLSFLLGLLFNGMFYVLIILGLSNRPVLTDSSSPFDHQSTQIRNQVARLLILTGTVFFICNAPLRIADLHGIIKNIFGVDILTKSQYDSIKIVGRACLFLNSSVNVFIYAFSSSFYRDGFRDALFCASSQRRNQTSVSNSSMSSKI